MDFVETIGVIRTDYLEEEFGALNTDQVVLTEERSEHIRSRHPEDYELFKMYGKACVEQPDIVMKDSKNENTVFMAKKIEGSNVNAVIRLSVAAVDDPSRKNSVMTFYRMRDINLNKKAARNKVLYRHE